ncbi:MAG: hypothetical protein Q4E62_01705 [Sutterellaceae bacterium]|nr:hypothetical protein [Sutterellaceae bacterium]
MQARSFVLPCIGFAAVALLAGCSTTVVFTSDIEGATVTNAAGELYGVTPTSVNYDNNALDDSRDANGCARITGVTYKWPSGATVTSDNPILLCGKRSQYIFRLTRPEDAPNKEVDLQNALERMRVRQVQLQADLERERLYSDHWFWMGPGFMWHMPGPPPPPRRPPRPPKPMNPPPPPPR